MTRFNIFRSPDAPAAEPPAAPPATPPATPPAPPSPANELVIDGKKYTPDDIKHFERVRSANRTLAQDGADPAAKEQALRLLLADSGMSPEVIEQAVAAQNGAGEDDKPAAKNKAQPSAVDQELARLKAELASTRQQSDATRVVQLKGMMDQSLTALDSDADLGLLLKRSKSLTSDEQAGKFKTDLIDRIREDTLTRLKRRADSTGGQWNDAWIGEEVSKAAKAHFGLFRSALGDIGSLGRTPETVSGSDLVLPQKPVERQVYKPGTDLGKLESNADAAETDVLLRELARFRAAGSTQA